MKGVWIRGFKSREGAERVLLSAGINPDEGEWDLALGTYGWKGRLRGDDDRWKVLQAKVRAALRADPLVSDLIEYTDEEIAAAELLCIKQFQVDSKGETGPEHGNEYDYSEACPICLSGAKLIPPFRMRERDLPKKRPVAETYVREYLVHDRIASKLRKIPGSEEWLVPVEDARSRRELPWWAIQPSATMPRMHPTTRGIVHETEGKVSSCRRCARDCWGTTYDEAMEIAYSRSVVANTCGSRIRPSESVPDVSGTWELVGPGSHPECPRKQVAQPFILVAQRVARELREHAGKWIWLVPVTLLD